MERSESPWVVGMKGCYKNDGKEQADTHNSVQIKAFDGLDGPHSPYGSQFLTVAISLVVVPGSTLTGRPHSTTQSHQSCMAHEFSLFTSFLPFQPRHILLLKTQPTNNTNKYILFYLVLRKLWIPHTDRCQKGMGIRKAFLQAWKGHAFQGASELATHWPSTRTITSLNTEV